ncbi:MAG: alpha/beta hydrolase family protein [Armatimonadota bacterium]|nr:alpha/beta hydrolase family protein [Armatimonadota bacterium]
MKGVFMCTICVCAIAFGILLASCASAEQNVSRSLLPAGSVWSGSGATILGGPKDLPLTVRFEHQEKEGVTATVGANWQPLDLRDTEVLKIEFSVSRPVRSVRVVLADKDGVGADNSLADLLKVQSLEPGQTYTALWAYRYSPGWVRYGRTRVRWEAIASISFYLGASDLETPLELTVTSLNLHTCDGLIEAGTPAPLRVIEDDDTIYRLQRYFVARAEELTAKAKRRRTPQQFKTDQDKLRASFRKQLMMPPSEGPARAISLGFVEIDGVKVEKRLINTRPGVYVTCNVYFPPDARGKAPGMLLLPGHGNMDWEAGIQELGLVFAKSGMVTYFVEPFGQGQRGFNPMRNELLGNMSTGVLIAAGQSLLGLIMDERRRVLDDMASRPEIDPEKLAVTGCSMGGTHTLWLSAIDPRAKVAVANAAVYFWRAPYAYCHFSLADLIVGQFQFGDDEIINSLIAPRTLVRLMPGANAPVSDEVAEKFREGWLDYTSMESKENWLTEQEALDSHFAYARSVYDAFGAKQEIAVEIAPGPHAYTREMRQIARGWLDHAFKGTKIGLLPEEPAVNPIPNTPVEKLLESKDKLYCWPDGKRPDDYLDPAQYALKVIQKKTDLLPNAPSSVREWREIKRKISKGVRKCVRTDYSKFSTKTIAGRKTELRDRTLTRLVVQPEKGIDIPILLATPKKTSGRLLIYLSPDGLARTAVSPRSEALLQRGWTIAFVDLRGVGETRQASESGGYIGFRDWDLCNNSLRLGDTVAGFWARDLNAVLSALRNRPELKDSPVSVWAEKETGFPAALIAANGADVDNLVLEGMLASYMSPRGYGGLYVYRDENGKPVDPQPTLSYGSEVPWIPNLLDYADVPQLLALCAPKRLLMLAPLGIDGKPNAGQSSYEWTQKAYSFDNRDGFACSESLSDGDALDWLELRRRFRDCRQTLAVGEVQLRTRMNADEAVSRLKVEKPEWTETDEMDFTQPSLKVRG